MDFAKINLYHVSMIPYLLEKLKNTPDGDGNLLDNTLRDLRVADGRFAPSQSQALPAVPRRPRGRGAQGRSAPQGGRRHADGQRDADASCTSSGSTISPSFGDSTGEFDLTSAPPNDRRRRSGVERMIRMHADAQPSRGRDSARSCASGAGVRRAERSSRRCRRARRQGRGARAARSRPPTSTPPQGDGMTALHWAAMRNDAALARCCCTPARTPRRRRGLAATRR